MNIQLFGLTLPGFPWWPLILWGIVWLAMLYRILTREDLDTLQKILWVLVVVFVPFFGVPLYLVAAPATPVDFSGPVVRGSDISGPPGAKDPG